MIRAMLLVLLSITTCNPTYALESRITLTPITGEDHVANLCLFNAFTNDPEVQTHVLEIDFETLVAKHISFFHEPDLLVVHQIPLHLEAEVMSLEVTENKEGCIKIFPKLMG